uniref:Protein lava lamp n=2 Tax=Drosophila melanogaster TaxID=7227 RepID=LVA_DROME|nr:lava lamp, isoform D [Drosophila melanogaster]NP_525064.1 lava lamp, isoform C [Drosophila melanogaster]Q8MSS1.2 RecName: Full=Protein lava lamp [Drosophila melanogaster]AAF45910.1 lava lamp, isoform C [Drosophila melanogaster]AHN59320.1 lava lamp, isoform D [Drosophila melanogaster]|eukprot:NP_001284849.1 lava lamp, isoform D [Drosophila melanogaster]
MAEDSGALESSYDFSIVQPDDHEYGEADIRLAGSSNDLSSLQNVSASTTRGTKGKGRLDSLKENLYKQQERLTALKERALRKSQDERHKSSMSDSMESLKTLGQKLTVLKTRSGDSSTPLVSPTKDSDPGDVSLLQTSGSEKLLMLTQRTEQNRALLEQRKRDLAKSLLSVKSNIGHQTTAELGSSMTDLRHAASVSNPPVSRHRSALDLEAQGQEAVDESRVKLLRSRMKLTELKQGRQEQELNELRTELAKRAKLIERLELSGAELQRTLTQRNEELEQLRVVQAEEDSLKVQENSRLQGEVLVLRERLAELENVNDLLETTRCELQEELTTARERQRNLELEQEQEKASRSPQSEAAHTDAQVSAELAKQLQELTNQLADLQATNEELRQQVAAQAKLQVTDEIVSQRLEELEATIAAQLLELQEQKSAMAAQNEELAEKTTELNVLNVNLRLLEEKLAQSSRSKPLFLEDHSEDSAASKQMQEDLQQLKLKLDETNKANIKLKLKCKQAEKKLQKFQSQDGQQQLASLLADNEELQQRIAVLEDEKGQWQLANMQEDDRQPEQSTESNNPLQLETIRLLEEQKLELQQALEALLSSSSSAESIEIVERHHLECLGQRRPASEGDAQEQKQVHPPGPSHVSELTQTEQTEEEDSSGETLSQLRERLELFTQERGEVLDKLEQLSAENLQLQARLEESSSSLQLLQREREKDLISSTSTSSNLSQELSSMQRSSEVVATLDAGEGGPVLFEKCEKSLSKLNSELEAYRKANDRQAKFNVSKKLAKEAKNCHTQLSELLHKVKEASTAVETVTVVETVVAVTAPNGKALAEYEQLNAQNAELKAVISRLRQELDELRESYPETEAPLAIVGSDSQREDEILQLQSQLEDARSLQAEQRQQIEEQVDQIKELRQTEAEQLQLVARQSAEITQLQLQSEQFDQLLNSKEMSHEKQLEQQTRIRRELEARAESLEGELSILQTLVAEQKQQLIESVSESEHALNLKMLELQSAQEELRELRAKEDPDQLREALRVSKSLVAQQVRELTSSQETVDALNQQIQEYQGLEHAHKEEQFKNRELREKLKKYALNLKKRTQDNADLEQKVQELTSQLQEQQELVKQKEEVEREPIVDNHRVEQLQQQVSKLNEDLKAKIHLNLENRDALRQLKQQIQEQEQLIQERDAELQDANLVSKELRRERQEADQEVFQLGQENSRLREEISKLQEEIHNLGQRVNEEPTAVEDLRRQLEAKSKKFEKSKELIKLRNATIQSLQRELQQLQQDQDSEVEHVRNARAAHEQLRLEKDAEITALRQEILKLERSRAAGEGDDTITKTSHQLLESQSQQQAESLQVAERELQQLRVQLTAAQEQHALLAQQYASDKANFEMTIARLETLHEGIQAKLQEDASYIESLEAQNTELQARSAALEEQAASQANQQAASQDKVQILEQQLKEQREQEEQKRQQDQQLQERFYELGQREQAQSRQLELLTSEAEESRQQLAGLRTEYESLLAKHSQLTATAQAEREQMSSHSQEELAELRQQLDVKEADLHRQRQVYDAKLAAKATELDELECDLNSHVERAAAETRELCQQLERSQELVAQRTEELQRLNEEFQEVERERSTLSREVTLLRLQHDSAEQDVLELQELRMQAMQDKTEMDNLRTQIDALCANHSQELQALQQRIAELDTLGQNQTDDQVYIETENKRLAEQLSELQAQLARQQHQQQQQQHHHPAVQSQQHPPPASLFFGGDALAAPSPFDEIAQPLRVSSLAASAPPPISPPPTIEDLQRNVSDLEKHAQDLETKLLARNQNLAEQEERRLQLEQRLSEVERLLSERTQQLADIQTANEERDRLAALEKLIQPAAAPTLDMFFGGQAEETVPDAVSHHLDLGLPQTEPVVEPLIQPKKAYLCQPKQEIQEQTAQTIDWGVDEDPWASAANEAPQTDVEHLHTRIAQLELQLSNAEQQKTELQTKAAKLMKRLKEYKTKATTTATPTVTVDNDLDSTIIEELKHQLQLQESRLSKAEEISQQHALEKEKLAKRIDVLTAGNDRMAEMKERQDMDVQMYQARIRELQEKLSQLDQWGEPAATVSSSLDGDEAARIESLQQEIQQLRQQVSELEDERTRDQAELGALRQSSQGYDEAEDNQKLELQQLRQQESELEALRTRDQSELEALRQSCQGHDETVRIATLQQDNQQLELQQLRQAIIELETLRARDQTELEALRQSSQGHDEAARIAIEQRDNQQLELQQLRQQLIELEALRARDQAELEALRQSCQGQQLSVDMASRNDEQMAQLQEKESEIVHLKQRIEELMREDQTEKLVFEILTKNQELQLLRMQVKQLEEDKEDQQVSAAPPKDDGETVEKLKSLCQQLQQEKSDMEEELRVLNNHVLSSLELEDRMKQTLLQLDTKNIEITELRRSLEILQSQNLGQNSAAEQIPDLSAINQQWEQLVEQKCGEVASIWQEHLSQREAAFKAQLEEVTQQQQRELPQSQQSTQGEATSDIMQKMQKALETQEMEIVTLKEQLAIRSAEYARLAAQYDPFRLQNRGGASGGNPASTTVSAGGPPSLTANEPLPEYVLKADLDYALMMLHQRDMRVEEMIVELVQLLEERDHLQLKLSDTLRQLETERSRVSDEPSATASSSAASSSSPSKISSAGSNSELLGTTSAAGSDLKQKLAELQTVKHSKDKVIVDEREQRLQQMLQLQKDMAKQGSGSQSGAGAVAAVAAPTSAAPTAIGVDLSQSGLRSPSMMLMDWILGNNNKEEEAGHQTTG